MLYLPNSKSLRTSKNISVADAAYLLGLSVRKLKRVECGKETVPSQLVPFMCRLYNCTLSELKGVRQ